jgi:hypothetical protein
LTDYFPGRDAAPTGEFGLSRRRVCRAGPQLGQRGQRPEGASRRRAVAPSRLSRWPVVGQWGQRPEGASRGRASEALGAVVTAGPLGVGVPSGRRGWRAVGGRYSHALPL